MPFEIALDIAKLALFVAGGWLALDAYARRLQPHWTEHLTRRRLSVLGLLTLVAAGVKVAEDVVADESGPVDEAILWWLREQVPAALGGFFGGVTRSGSATVLIPLAVVAAAVLLLARRRFEAALLVASTVAATGVVYVLKTIVGRARPALWETQWYWGSSFPSGHTLSTAAFSTAAALCVAHLAPRYARAAMLLAFTWTAFVALSRLVLGVHWPSDVLVAACIGVFIPLSVSVVVDLRRGGNA